MYTLKTTEQWPFRLELYAGEFFLGEITLSSCSPCKSFAERAALPGNAEQIARAQKMVDDANSNHTMKMNPHDVPDENVIAGHRRLTAARELNIPIKVKVAEKSTLTWTDAPVENKGEETPACAWTGETADSSEFFIHPQFDGGDDDEGFYPKATEPRCFTLFRRAPGTPAGHVPIADVGLLEDAKAGAAEIIEQEIARYRECLDTGIRPDGENLTLVEKEQTRARLEQLRALQAS